MRVLKKLILIVDDDPLTLGRLRNHLEAEGYRVVTAEDGVDGLALARRSKPDMVVTGLALPGMNGVRLTKALRSDPEFGEVPIVWMTPDFAEDGIWRESSPDTSLLRSVIILHRPVRGRDLERLAKGFLQEASVLPRAGHVLVVDDDPANLELIERRLEAEDFSCVLVETGAAGIEQASRHAFDAVLLDLRLPDMDGLEVLAAIRKQSSSLPVVIMTAHGSEAIAVKALTAGATNYLIKPIGRRDLLAALRDATEKLRREVEQNRMQQELIDAMRILREGSAPEVPARPPSRPGAPALPPGVEDLSSREIEIVSLLAQGLDNREIASILVLSEKTVGNHLTRIYEKLKVNNRTLAVVLCLQHGLIMDIRPNAD